VSPILDLQRRVMEQGRIRFGNKKGNRPNRLDHPLLTSPDKALIESVGPAEPWTGDPAQWQHEHQGPLRVLIPLSPEPYTQWWERWISGGCVRRCDGIRDTIHDNPCDCDKESEKRACSATTRFVVLLPQTGDARWRVETKSLWAAMELPDILERARGEDTGEIIEAELYVDHKPGKKGKVPVPTLRLTSGTSQAPAEHPALPAGGEVPGVADPVEPPASPEKGPTIKQVEYLWIIAGEKYGQKRKEQVVRTIMADLAPGVESTKDLTRTQYEAVLDAVAAGQDPHADALFGDAA